MLRLDEVRLLYPEYAGMTDYELSSAVHQARYPDMPYEAFAQQFRGPLQEDPDAVAVRDYNLRHPDSPIRREDMGKGSILSDIGDSIKAGAQELGGDALWALGQGAGAVGLDSAAGILGSAGRALHGWAEDTRRSMSPEMRIARDKQYLIDVPEDEGGGWRMGDAWTDPRSILGTVAESLPSMAGGIGVGGLIARGLLSRGLSKGLAYAIGHGIGEGGVAGMQDSSQVHRQVMEMPYDTLAKSPEFQQLMERYQDPEQARRALADSIAGTVAVDAGIAVGLMGAPMGGVYGRMLGGQTGKTLARTVGRHAIGEAIEEMPQSGYEQHAMQSQLQRADPSIDPWSGVANAAVQGGLAGAFTGAVMGVPGHVQGQRVRSGLLAVIPESEREAAKEMSTDDLIKLARGYDTAAVDSILGIKPVQGITAPIQQPQQSATTDFDNLISVPAWDGSTPSLDQQWDEEAARRGWTHLQSEESLSRDKTVDISPLWTPPSDTITNPASPELNAEWDAEAQRRGRDDLLDVGTSSTPQQTAVGINPPVQPTPPASSASPTNNAPNDFEAALAAGTPPSKDEILSSLPPQMAQRVRHWSDPMLQGLWDEYQTSPDGAADIIDAVEAQEAQQAGQGQGQPQPQLQSQEDMTPEELEDALLEADTEAQVQQSPLDDALAQIDTGLQQEITAAERRQQSVAERRRAILDQLPEELRQEYQGDSLQTLEKVLARYQEQRQDEKKNEELPPPPPPVDVQNDVVQPQSDNDVVSAVDTDGELANLEDELQPEEKPAEKSAEEKPTQQTPQTSEASEAFSEVESEGQPKQAESANASPQQQEETSPPKSVKEQREELAALLPPEKQEEARNWSLSRLRRETDGLKAQQPEDEDNNDILSVFKENNASKKKQEHAARVLKAKEKGLTPSIVDMFWLSKPGVKYDPREDGLVDAEVSDWENARISEGSGKKITHVYMVDDGEGNVMPYGRDTAMQLVYGRESHPELEMKRIEKKLKDKNNKKEGVIQGVINSAKERANQNPSETYTRAIKLIGAVNASGDKSKYTLSNSIVFFKKDNEYTFIDMIRDDRGAVSPQELINKMKELGYSQIERKTIRELSKQQEGDFYAQERKEREELIAQLPENLRKNATSLSMPSLKKLVRRENARGQQEQEQGKQTSIAIPNREAESVTFRLMEADDVQTSHLPESSFQKNPKYGLENERRYHDEPASQAKVLNNAQNLDPAFLLESVDANHGAPVVDQDGNVLGGNGRAMSIRHAYDKFPDRAKAYRNALREHAQELGINPQQIDAMRRPVLVRSLGRTMDAKERQELVSALNDTFTDSKNSRASGKSRGDRLSRESLTALGKGLAEADSLREFFDQPESVAVVENLIRDGVINNTERNAYVAADGTLNPDGKRVVEEALRGRVARSYDSLAKLSAPVVAKIDAAIPHLLVAENVGGEWDITRHVSDAIDLLSEFKESGEKEPSVFLKQANMMKGGKSAEQRYSPEAIAIFHHALDMPKKKFVDMFGRFAAQAKVSSRGGGIPGVAKSGKQAAREFLGIDLKPLVREGITRKEDNEAVEIVRLPQNVVPEFKYMKEFATWLKDMLVGGDPITITSTQQTAQFTNEGVDASLKRAHSSAHKQAYGALREMVEKAEYDHFEPADARHPDRGGQDVYHAALDMGGKLYSVRLKFDVVTEREKISEEAKGKIADENVRYKDHKLAKIEVAPALYRGMADNGGATQNTDAINAVSLGVLRQSVKPSRVENGTLYSIRPGEFLPPANQEDNSDSLVSGRRERSVAVSNDIRRVANQLSGAAQNAAETVVVERFEDLPEELRANYEDNPGALEGLYDPKTGKVYFVAENLADGNRAAEVWTHEQVVHNGLRGLTTPEERRTLMGRLWLGMGGMGNEAVRDVAERYNLDPRNNVDDRTEVMEEVVARLAEKKAKGLLTGKEKGFWRRIVDAVRRLWDKLVTRVTGKSSAMRAENVDDLLTALGRYVMDGIGGVAEQTGTASTSTSTEAPLASLSSTAKAIADKVGSVVNTETVAAATRGLRKIAKRGVSADVEAILQDPDMGKLVGKEDMGMLERVFKLPYWIAREKNPFTPIYERQQKRMEDKVAATSKDIGSMSLLFDEDRKKQLNDKEYKGLTDMIHKWDGKPIFALNGVDKFLVTGHGVNGRDVLAINPEFRRKFNAWLRTQGEPEKVKEAFRQVREALDDAFLKAYNRMAEMSEIADTDIEMYRTEFGSIHNYFPHHRKGKYFVIATKGQGVVGDPKKTVFRKHFDVPFGSSVREEWAKIVAENRNKPEFAGATWENPREVEKLPDDILGAPLDPQAMEQIIKSALQKVQDPTQRGKIEKMMLEGISDILKARGWGAHGIKRQGIPGYEMENVKEVLYDYFSGMNGWLTKMDAARDFAQGLGKIDAAKTPRLWGYASQYVKDMLRNSDRTDKLANNVKTLAFAWYLGGNFKTAVVNATQNVIIGAPRLGQYVGGGYRRWLKGAADTIGMHYHRQGIKGARVLTADEEAMLERMYGSGIINAAYMDELQGQLTDSPVLKGWRKFVALLGKPMAMVECFNRASLALAAYRAAKEGSWRPFAEQELGVRNGQGMSNEDAEAFASMIVRDSHFEYGRGNMPEYLRSNWTGRALSPVYTFRSFGANALNLWYRALTKEGMAGKKFVAQTLGATIALGGLTSLPFFATLSALCGALSGDDEDWKTKVRRAVGQDDMRQNMVLYGLPALAGFTLSGSLRMETPLTEGLEKGETLKDVFDTSLLSLLGIPRDLYVKASRAVQAHDAGNDYKAVEALVPTFAANVMKAYRMATEGQTTMKGKPITEPGGKEARKLTRWEAGGQALGFQPVSNAESYERYQAEQRAKARRTEMIDRLAGMFNDGREPGNDGRARMMRELRKWNDEMEAAGRTGMRISPKNVYTRAKNKRNPRKPSAVDRGMQKDWMAMTGS